MKLIAYLLLAQSILAFAAMMFSALPFARDIQTREYLKSLGEFRNTTSYIKAFEGEEIELNFEEEKKEFQQVYWGYLEDHEALHTTGGYVGLILLFASAIEGLALLKINKRKRSNQSH
ncbi:hypothetical protein ACWPKS_17330 [Coraliomargarita sp. W4R72]